MRDRQERHHRRSIRLRNYDYSQPGAYFITVRTHKKRHLFGNIVGGAMRLNAYGRIVWNEWRKTANLRKNIVLDEFVIMPNHIHGIIFVTRRGVLQYAPTNRIEFRSPSQTVGAIVRGFKSGVTKRINVLRKTPYAPVWQRNYWEHVIRDERDLNRRREYIMDNPIKWEFDKNNPDN